MEAWERSCKFIDMLNKLDYEVAFGNFRAQISEYQEANRFHRRGGSRGGGGGVATEEEKEVVFLLEDYFLIVKKVVQQIVQVITIG